MQTLRTSIDSVLKTTDGLYFFDRGCNAIWYADKELNNLKFLRSAASDVKLNQFAAFGTFRNEASLFIGSQIGLEVLEYRILENRFSLYGFDKGNQFEKGIYNNVAYGNKIFRFPVVMNHPVFVFDMESREYCEINPISQNETSSGFVFHKGTKTYIPEVGGNMVCEFDMETLDVKKTIFSDHIKLYSICSEKGVLYGLDKNQKTLWKKEDSSEMGIQIGDGDTEEEYGKLVCCGRYILILPRWGRFLSLYDTESKQVSKIEVSLDADAKLKGGGSLFWGHYVYGSKVVFLPWILPELYIFDFSTKNFQKRYLEYELNKEFLSSYPVMLEKNVGLEDFITVLQKNEGKPQTVHDNLCGRSIYEAVMQIRKERS